MRTQNKSKLVFKVDGLGQRVKKKGENIFLIDSSQYNAAEGVVSSEAWREDERNFSGGGKAYFPPNSDNTYVIFVDNVFGKSITIRGSDETSVRDVQNKLKLKGDYGELI